MNNMYIKIKAVVIILTGIVTGIIIATHFRNFIISNTDCSNTLLNEEIVKIVYSPLIEKESNLLFVGVITANKYIHTRAKAVYETWGQSVPGKILFFTSEKTEPSSLPVIYMEGVDDSYPPQKKSFMMLKYMFDNLIDKFEYFMRADDDLYIKTDKIELFLNSLNSSNLLYIGQAGQGTIKEIGHLSLSFKENFCMGGPGMIFSKAALKKLGPHLIDCLVNLKSDHEDVEIGRCVQTNIKIPCTWSYEMRNIFYHNSSGAESFTGSLHTKEVHQAITLHPLKKSQLMYRMHNYIQTLAIKEKEAEIIKLIREIDHLKKENGLKFNIKNIINEGIFLDHLGSDSTLNEWTPSSEFDVVSWNFLNHSLYQLNDENPKHRIPNQMNEAVADSVREFMSMLNRVSHERGRIIEFKNLLFGYTRLHPTYAAQYIFDLLLTYKRYRGKKMTIPVRRHVYMQVPFGPLYIREAEVIQDEDKSHNKFGQISNHIWKSLGIVVNTNKLKRINFILTLAGRVSTFNRFID